MVKKQPGGEPPDPVYDPTNSFGYLLRISFRSFSRAIERRTLKHGISSGQWRFLRVLWMEDELTQKELSRRVGMREPTTVTAVKSLARAGLVTQRKSEEDKRRIHICLTPRARKLRDKLLPYVVEVNHLGLKGVTPAQAALVRQVLLKIVENLSTDDGDS